MIRRSSPYVCLLAVLFAGCMAADPSSPEGYTDEMQVLLLLDPSQTTQVALVEAVDVGGLLEDVRVVVTTPDEQAIATGVGMEHLGACIARYGILATVSDTKCVLLSFSPTPGEAYRVEISAEGRPTATASVLIPGDFWITDFEVDGDPPGSRGLTATWEASSGSYRYAVAISPETPTECFDVGGCDDGWSKIVSDTTFSDRIPDGTTDRSSDWYFDVYALSKGLHDFITTGAGGDVFPVPPSQNVTNGFGMVGAWVRKSHLLSSGS